MTQIKSNSYRPVIPSGSCCRSQYQSWLTGSQPSVMDRTAYLPSSDIWMKKRQNQMCILVTLLKDMSHLKNEYTCQQQNISIGPLKDQTPFLTINDREISDRFVHLQLLNCAIWDVQETLQPEHPPTAGCQWRDSRASGWRWPWSQYLKNARFYSWLEFFQLGFNSTGLFVTDTAISLCLMIFIAQP